MDEMPEISLEIMSITLDRTTGAVEVDYQGMNYLEAIGVLTVALNQIQDEPLFADWSEDEEDQ